MFCWFLPFLYFLLCSILTVFWCLSSVSLAMLITLSLDELWPEEEDEGEEDDPDLVFLELLLTL